MPGDDSLDGRKERGYWSPLMLWWTRLWMVGLLLVPPVVLAATLAGDDDARPWVRWLGVSAGGLVSLASVVYVARRWDDPPKWIAFLAKSDPWQDEWKRR
jgi:hypothetical protein